MARIAVTGAAVAAVVTLAASPALAVSNKTITFPAGKGKMTFIDDGDMFEVCDTAADGYGMTGQLIDRSYAQMIEVTDGGDSGCDKKGYNIGNWTTYQMWLTWNGDSLGTTVKSEWFNE
ncbi:hypothetical protein ACIRF8_34165 [Streptomyces sp. NPDC102406]|uniref:hypothetical protein n=1 Tax=Streptomyces sp. NPDC102406 TaxID=3366171 RepID=UPI003819FACC